MYLQSVQSGPYEAAKEDCSSGRHPEGLSLLVLLPNERERQKEREREKKGT